MTAFSLLAFSVGTFLFQVVQCQYFSPNMTDQVYLDITHDKVKTEVDHSRQQLVDQAEVIQQATRAYIGAKIKENLFKALRILAEKELETLSMQNRPRQPRQDEDEDDETTTAEPGLIPQLAQIVTGIFGSNVNVTKYVETASKFLPRPIGSQLVGIVSLLDPSQFTTTTAPKVVPAPTQNPVNVTVIVPQYVQGQTPSSVVATQASATTSRTTAGSDEDEDEGIRSQEPKRTSRQFKGVNPMQLLSGMEALWNSFQPNVTATEVPHVKAASTTESADGFDDDFTPKPSKGAEVLKGVMTQAQNLRKGVPDLFEGAREAYKFLETLNGFLDKWSARLAAGSVEDEE